MDALSFHNLKTPLAAVKNALAMISEGFTKQILNRETKKYLEEALKQNQKAIDFIEQLERAKK